MNDDNYWDLIIDTDEIIEDFRKSFIENMEDLGPEFQKVIDDDYWELKTDTDIPEDRS